MRPDMLQYIHDGYQGKEKNLLWAKDTVFWPNITHDVQMLVEKCSKYQEYGKSQPVIERHQEIPQFPGINSTSYAVCIDLSMIVTEFDLPFIIGSDNGPCYISKEFLQCYSIDHQTKGPMHPRANVFVECMVGTTKKLMDKARKEGKPWILGLLKYRVTPQMGSVASSMELMMQRKPRATKLLQLPSNTSC